MFALKIELIAGTIMLKLKFKHLNMSLYELIFNAHIAENNKSTFKKNQFYEVKLEKIKN